MLQPAQALELENFLPYRLSVLAQFVSASLHDLYAKPFELSVTEWRVMAVLGRFAPLAASEVAKRIVMDKVAVSRAVASLKRRDLVERATDPEDRRRASLRLSPSGHDMHARIIPVALEYESQLVRALSSEEQHTLNQLCDRLFSHAKMLRIEA